METTHHTAPTLLTERERLAVDRINAVLNSDGSDPEAGPGAWADCGEVDVPVVLDALSRIGKMVLTPAQPAPLADAELEQLEAQYNAAKAIQTAWSEGNASFDSANRSREDASLAILNALPGLLARVRAAAAKPDYKDPAVQRQMDLEATTRLFLRGLIGAAKRDELRARTEKAFEKTVRGDHHRA